MDVATLADLLHETAEHHGAFEARRPKHDWWDWYAPLSRRAAAGDTPEEAACAADRYMAEVLHVVPTLRGSGGCSGRRSDRRDLTAKRLRRILAATDGSPRPKRSGRLDLAAEHGSELIFVHVVPLLDVGAAAAPPTKSGGVPARPEPSTTTNCSKRRRRWPPSGEWSPTTALLAGAPAAEIVRHSESHDADLVVVGSHGRGPVAGALHGSVSRGVLHTVEAFRAHRRA